MNMLINNNQDRLVFRPREEEASLYISESSNYIRELKVKI
jgi:hypothetical protein